MASDGQTHQFIFRATRNTATLYPGPLAGTSHLAFLSMLIRGDHVANTRVLDLARTLPAAGDRPSGRMVATLERPLPRRPGC